MRFLLILVSFICIQGTQAQVEELPGYYITSANNKVITTFKLRILPGLFKGPDNIYEELPVLTDGGVKMKLNPSEVKEFYFKRNGEDIYFVSFPFSNKKLKFWQVLYSTAQLDILEHSNPTRNANTTQLALVNSSGDTLYIGPDDGNQKTKKRLRNFFADRPDILTMMAGMKELFTRPGLVQYDMSRIIRELIRTGK
jgi:hypothetical protein